MVRIVKIVDRTSAHTLAALDDHAQGDRANLIPVRRDALFKAVECEVRPRSARRAFVYRLPGDERDQLSRQHYCFRLRINKHGRHHLFLSLLTDSLRLVQQRAHSPQTIVARTPASDSTRSRAAFAAAIVVSASRPISGSSESMVARPAAASSAFGVQRCTQCRSTDAFSGRFEIA